MLIVDAKFRNAALKATGAPSYSSEAYPYRDIHGHATRFSVRARVNRTTLLAALALALGCHVLANAADPAQNYPSRPVRLIAGSPGSTADASARFIAQKLGERWRHQVIVDNRPGGNGIIGAEIGARALPDGHTLIINGVNIQASAQFLYKNLPFDPEKDFVPITMLTNSGIVLGVVPSVPARNLKEFIAYAKSKPGVLHYASSVAGSSSHLSAELFNQMTGAGLIHVPYKGAGFAVAAILTGEVQVAFLSTTTTYGQVKAGKLRALALLSSKRFPATPDIPTAAEQGLHGLGASVWFGLFAPAKTPKAIIERVNRDVVSILKLPEAQSALLAQGAEAVSSTPEEFNAFIKSEIAKWGKVIKEARIVVN